RMIAVLRDPQGNEYYCLKSDVVVEKFMPKYLVDVVRHNYNTKAKANVVLLEHLNVLEVAFSAQKR
ncbi:MAG: hypothetical protein RBG13Loki_1692, partial [Promethearchaeota archaeon CR_4]